MLETIIAHLTGTCPLIGAREGPPCNAIIISPEQDVREEIVPRLAANGADLSRCHAGDLAANGSAARPVMLPDDHSLLRQMVQTHRARMLVLDPITRRLSPGHQVRAEETASAVLMPLVQLAAETGCCICYTCHLRKDRSGDALDWVLGAGGWTGIPRYALLLGRDPQDPDRRVMTWSRCASRQKPPARRYTIDGRPGLGRFVFGAEATIRADDMRGEAGERWQRDALQEAKNYLRQMLSEDRQLASQITQAAQQAGIAVGTLRRAKSELGIGSSYEMSGGACRWYWTSPAEWPAEPGQGGEMRSP